MASERLYTQAAQKIIELCKSLNLDINDRVPPERQLAESIQVSRTVIREALVYLELAGVLSIKKGSGAYIRAFELRQEQNNISKGAPFEVLEARLAIEPTLARHAARNKTDTFIKELEKIIRMMEYTIHFSQSDLVTKASIDCDKQFHLAIASMSDNNVLVGIHKELIKRHMDGPLSSRMEVLAGEPINSGVWIPEHMAIFDAIAKGDEDKAEMAMKNHLTNVIEQLLID